MIKFLISFFLITTAYANDEQKASSIFNMIVKNITKKENPNVCIHTDIDSIQNYPGALKIVSECDKSDIVIVSTTNNLPPASQEKIIFGTRYSHLKNPSVVGAFFWQKGRPNILFYKKRLQLHNIKLDESFDKYIENEYVK